MSYLLSELAAKIGGTVRGDGDLQIDAILGLETPAVRHRISHPSGLSQAGGAQHRRSPGSWQRTTRRSHRAC